MTQDKWTAVDTYFNALFIPPDPALDKALAASAAAGLPAIAVSPTQGKLLLLLAKIQGARKILELGTLGGYSTIWLARALPKGGRLVTLEVSPKHAEVARANIAQAGQADKVEIRVGPALETLPALIADGAGPFDLIFIDADKENNAPYFDYALKLSRPGTVMIIDNVVRDGAVADPATTESSAQGVRRLNERLIAEPRATATAIQTVGAKGYDGFAIILIDAN
jgi:predicted O-methyltransferase YrrM